MGWVNLETEIRVVGVLAFLCVIYPIWMGRTTVQGLPAGYQNPVLALQLVANKSHIDVIKQADGGKSVAFIRSQLTKDLGYVVLYVLFFGLFGLLLTRLVPANPWLGWCAVGCAVVGGLLDLLENRGMTRALEAPHGSATDSLANSIRFSSLGKWGMLYIFCLLVGLALASQSNLLRIPGAFFLLAALCGLSGVIANLIKPQFYWMFPAAIVPWGLGITCVAFFFTLLPGRVLRDFSPLN